MEDSMWLDRHQNEVLHKRRSAGASPRFEVVSEDVKSEQTPAAQSELESQFNMDFVPPAESHFVIDEFVRGERSVATEKTMGLIMRFAHATSDGPLLPRAGKRRIEEESSVANGKRRATQIVCEERKLSSSLEELGLDHCMLDGVEEDLAGEASLSETLKRIGSAESAHCMELGLHAFKKVD
eukprot:767242-Hanusia_phi.AAC.2